MKQEVCTMKLQWQRVAPRRGAWIETLEEAQRMAKDAGRTPQGCVD